VVIIPDHRLGGPQA